ncbi:MAG TPA: hypothetical protein VFR70_08820 [Flavobacterium sp.]|nr:hypothetical protein [Flavobacterium sp.]
MEQITYMLNTFYKKNNLGRFLIAGIIATTLMKLFLMGDGFLAFPDEWRYTASGHVLKEIQAGNLKEAVKIVFSTQGRPMDTAIKIIPNGMQYISARLMGLEYYESANSYPLFFFNFIIFCLTLIVQFKFSHLILKNFNLSLFSVLMFGCLLNSCIYLRHGLPYDTSFLILYFIFYKVLKNSILKNYSFLKSFFFGFFVFAGYLAYPGYFALAASIGLFFFLHDLNKENAIGRIKFSSAYIGGSLSCLLVFELISRLAGTSYINSLQELSGTLNQGSFEECFTFIFKYLLAVEKASGILLISGLAGFTVLCFQKKSLKAENTFILLFSILILIFLMFAGTGYFLHKSVMNGRFLHQFFPFLCLLFAYLHAAAKNKKAALIFVGSFSLIFIINFTAGLIGYQKFSYPRDVAWRHYRKYNPKKVSDYCEMKNSWTVLPITEVELKKFKYKATDRQIIIVNSCSIFPFKKETYSEFRPSNSQKEIFSRPSYINFKGYQLEGNSIEERSWIDLLNLPIKVFIE